MEPVFSLTRKDFKVDWFSGTGAGGQNRNKVQACVRITHLATNITCVSQSHRDRAANQRDAFHALVKQITPWIREQILGEQKEREKSTEVVRTYHIADNRVKDAASGLQMPWDTIQHDLGPMIEARLHAVLAEVQKALLDELINE